jgi:hypothetical protein
MKIGFIVECAPLGPEEILAELLVACFRPKDQSVVIPMLNKGKLLSESPSEARKLLKSGCHQVFILWDWHPQESSWIQNKKTKPWKKGDCRMEASLLRKALDADGMTADKVVLTCVSQEVEAWALADKRAIYQRLQNRLKNHPPKQIKVAKTARPEEEPNPERRLENIFRRNRSSLVKHSDVTEIIKYAAKDCFRKWDVCPSFVRLVGKLSLKGFSDACASACSSALL